MPESTNRPFVVMKFGGTSVSSLTTWENIAGLLKKRIAEGYKPIMVASALSGISNTLEDLIKSVSTGKHEEIIKQIKQKHIKLANDLGVDGEELLKGFFTSLERLSLGASLIQEVSPKLHAQIMAHGELMSTTLGAAYLNKNDVSCSWVDARTVLCASNPETEGQRKHFMSSACNCDPDDTTTSMLKAKDTSVILTQGFIANDDQGATVLLGRGGSDTSASYIAAKISAERCEIWTDVPGIYTANPKQIPAARLLKSLSYDEAQEITSTGAKVLHPRCIQPVMMHDIPLHVYCTDDPDTEGSVISNNAPETIAQVKAISTKTNVMLISMETISMWQEVGFLAKVFNCFKKHGLSVDQVSTSQTNVSVTLDAAANVLAKETMDALMADLNEFCSAESIDDCALVSLVGRNIRSILHKLGPALEVFGEQKIHLVTQAANDLNLAFVVAEENADRLVRELHGLLFKHRKEDDLFGLTWEEVFVKEKEQRVIGKSAWWRAKREQLLAYMDKTPAFVYDEETLLEQVSELNTLKSVNRFFYAMKANNNPQILKMFYDSGLGFECVSPGEVSHIFDLFPEISPDRIIYTPNFAPKSEYEFGFEKGVFVTLDNLFPLEKWPELFAGKEVFLRLDTGKGAGHHKYVHTAGAHSKFGIYPEQMDYLQELLEKCGAKVIGLHSHIGSGILAAGKWKQAATFLCENSEKFKDVKYIDLGGGLGIPEKPGQNKLDLEAVDKNLAEIKRAYADVELWMEPGRFLVATAGVLLAQVTQTKQKGPFNYIGVNSGMHTLIRPALYGAYHEIVNITHLDEDRDIEANVVGQICETGDTLGYDRKLPKTSEGDLMLIATAGAYGRAMSSSYNMRPPATEYILKKG